MITVAAAGVAGELGTVVVGAGVVAGGVVTGGAAVVLDDVAVVLAVVALGVVMIEAPGVVDERAVMATVVDWVALGLPTLAHPASRATANTANAALTMLGGAARRSWLAAHG
jgi:hypothetical protein